MKNMFTGYLFLNLFLEGLAAVILIGDAQGILSVAQVESSIWSMTYGFAAIAIASAIFWVWPHRENRETVGAVLGLLLSFHALIFISFALQGDQMPPAIAHAVMAAFGILLYMQRSKWCMK